MAKCSVCGGEHDLHQMEPSYRMPDPVLSVPPEDRAHCVMHSADWAVMRDRDDTWRRYFVRVLMPFDVAGWQEQCCWGVWVEISAGDYDTIGRSWREPEQDRTRAFAAQLANSLRGYELGEGLTGVLRLTGAETLPTFHFADDVLHPLAQQQRSGVTVADVERWLHEHGVLDGAS